MGDEPKKPRASSMSDDARALVGAKHRGQTQPGSGIPEQVPEEDSMPVLLDERYGDTPVMTSAKRTVTIGGKRRRGATERQYLEELWQRDRELGNRIDDLMSKSADRIAEVATKASQIEGRLENLDQLGDSVGELRQLRVDHTALETRLFGVQGKNGRLGAIEAKAGLGRKLVMWAVFSVLGSAGGAVLFIWKLNGDAVDRAATVRAQIEAGQRDRDVMHDQINLLFRLMGERRGSADPGSVFLGVPP